MNDNYLFGVKLALTRAGLAKLASSELRRYGSKTADFGLKSPYVDDMMDMPHAHEQQVANQRPGMAQGPFQESDSGTESGPGLEDTAKEEAMHALLEEGLDRAGDIPEWLMGLLRKYRG